MLDKTPIKSKKFIAYMISEFGWKAILFYLLYHLQGKLDHYSLVILMTIVITSGFIQIGYILGQAALDKYVNAAVDILDKDENKKNVEEEKEKKVLSD